MVSAEAWKEGDLRSNAAHGGVPLRFASGIINTGAIRVLKSGKMSVWTGYRIKPPENSVHSEVFQDQAKPKCFINILT